MNEIELLSRAIDPIAWSDHHEMTSRGSVEGVHLARQEANAAARRVYAAVGPAFVDSAIAVITALREEV